jgi:hypothetical protein
MSRASAARRHRRISAKSVLIGVMASSPRPDDRQAARFLGRDELLRQASLAPDLETAWEHAGFTPEEIHRFVRNLVNDPRPSSPRSREQGREALYQALCRARNGGLS